MQTDYSVSIMHSFDEVSHLFVELVQVSIGNKEHLSRNPNPDEWEKVYSMAQQQAVAGLLFKGIEKITPKGQKPPSEILFDWIGLVEHIRERNKRLNKCAVELTAFFREEGFKSCILKGQGNAMLYPNPFTRTPGDIDIWIEADKFRIKEFVHKNYPDAKECAWHIDYPIYKDVDVEVHFMPSFMRHPRYNKRLQEYYKDHASAQFSNYVNLPNEKEDVCVPEFEFNVVQQLSHIMRHFFVEGVGLRQIIDIYYLLQTSKNHDTNLCALLQHLGLYRFSKAVMWVLHEKLGFEDKYFIAPMDKTRGNLLFRDIMKGGNWGRYDKGRDTSLIKKWGLYIFVKRALRMGYLISWPFVFERFLYKISETFTK